MTYNLEKLKELKERGAGIRMQEDVASFLGGSDSPLFLPTIEFILDIQQAVRETSQEKDLDLAKFGIPEVFDPTFFDKVSIKASTEAIKSSTLMDTEKRRILDYLDNMEIQRADSRGVLGDDSKPASEIYASRAKIPESRKSRSKVKSVFKSLIAQFIAVNVRMSMFNTQAREQQRQVSLQRSIRDLISRTVFCEARNKMAERAEDESQQEENTLLTRIFSRKKKSNATSLSSNSHDDFDEDSNFKARKEDKIAELENSADYKHEVEAQEKAQGNDIAALNRAAQTSREKKSDKDVQSSKVIDDIVKARKEGKKEQSKDSGQEEEQGKSRRNRDLQRQMRVRLNQRLIIQQLQQQRMRSKSAAKSAEHGVEHGSHHHIEEAIRKLRTSGVSEINHSEVSMNDLKKMQPAQDQQKERH
ncbi:MAG: hypothetical protein COV36_05545 [Alphaproteobacteria bacterium CG11_big_fil_rev_8_21_14_0_20_44_7]|nr:MAG: hypothetical protein COV36_05545 [Alphaproteobacteria bacterium CG11_big_fil_rev_8_21_14_0_20_44_7]